MLACLAGIRGVISASAVVRKLAVMAAPPVVGALSQTQASGKSHVCDRGDISKLPILSQILYVISICN